MSDDPVLTPAQEQEARQKLLHYASIHGQHILLLTSEEAHRVAIDYHRQAGAPEHSPRTRCDITCKYVQFEAIAAALLILERYRLQTA